MFNPQDPIHELLQMQDHKWLGSGAMRDVFSFGEDRVIKVARVDRWGHRVDGIEANMIEIRLWETVQSGRFYAKMKKWLAPCHYTSYGGIFLVQERTYPMHESEYPKRIPNWITDTKYGNMGKLKDGTPVFHDYGLNLLVNGAAETHALVKAEWWGVQQ